MTLQTGEIAERLNSPDEEVSLEGLAERWFRSVARFRMPGMAVLAADPGLIGRIRGAFGQRLAASASREALAGQPCPWEPPCAFEPLWRKQGQINGVEHASPWLIRLDPVAGDLIVELVVFGFANDWMLTAMEMMAAALLHDVDWRGQTRYAVPKPSIISRVMRVEQGVALPAPVQTIRIELFTPLAFTNSDPREKPRSLIMGLIKRLDALARWHDSALDTALDRDAVASWMADLTLDWQDCAEVEWQRGSKKQNAQFHMGGLIGTLLIENQQGEITPDLLLALRLGETCHWGADIAFGCGRYGMRAP